MQSVRTVAKSLVIPYLTCRHKVDSRIAFAVETLRCDPLDRQEQANAFATMHDSLRIDSSPQSLPRRLHQCPSIGNIISGGKSLLLMLLIRYPVHVYALKKLCFLTARHCPRTHHRAPAKCVMYDRFVFLHYLRCH